MRMLKRLVAPVALAGVVASAILFGPAAPAHATASDGITIGEFAYVTETNDWLDVTLAGCPSPAPTFVVLNIGSGTTDDVGHLDTVAQTIMGCGIKVYGYVNVCASACGTSLAVLRSANDVATDVNRWVNPFNAERNVGGRMVDGIFFDQYPRDCGPIETPTNSTGNDADYVLRGDTNTDYVHDVFAFWSYGTPLVMANVGTAVRGCHPGWEALSGHPMPDYWVTAENDWSTYEAGWAGGNLLTGGTFGTTYEEGNSSYPGAFVHIVHDASTMADTEAAIDLADARGAASVFVTDDQLANPYDTEPTYHQGALTYAATGPMGFRMDYGNDFVPGIFSGTDYIGVLRETYDPNCDNPGTPGTVERCTFPTDGLDIIYDTVTAKCGGSWGTAGHTLGESGGIYDPDSTRIACARALAEDGTGRDPTGFVCATVSHIREWTDEDATNDEADCQDPDGSGTYSAIATGTGTDTTVFRSVFFSTDTRAKAVLVYAREDHNGTLMGSDYPLIHANCVIGRWDVATPLPFRICP
jgi:hypothetical protein